MSENPPEEHIVIIGPDGQPVGTVPTSAVAAAQQQAEAARGDDDEERHITELVEHPAKVMRIGSMIRQLLEEVKAAPLDEASRLRLKEIHQASIKELEAGLAPELVEELERAGAVGGPLLLTTTASVPSAVLAEIERLGASKVYVLGGTGAVSAAALAQIDALAGVSVERVFGADRYATAKAVAEETISILGSGYSGEAFMATGLDFPDALASSPIMAARGTVLVLVDGSGVYSLPADVDEVKILGGTGVVPASVQTALGARYEGRLAGANRYSTAVAVAEYGVSLGMTWDNLGVATGQNFPDALCAGPLLGSMDSVLLLTTSATIASDPAAALAAHKADIASYYLFGGVGALSTNVRAQIAEILASSPTGSHSLPALFCAGSGCHDTDLATIHIAEGCAMCHGPGITPTNDCESCHEAAHEGTHVVITSEEGARLNCTLSDCHGSDALDIHPSCVTCHNPTTELAGTTCQACHGDMHLALPAAHAVPGLCSASTCHGTDVMTMHTMDFRGTGNPPPGCAACHAPGVTPTTDCSVCHFNISTQHDAVAAHADVQETIGGTRSSACVACHGSDLMAVAPGEHVGCSCHAYGEVRGATECVDCHQDQYAPHGFVNGFAHGEGWIPASGHNTTTFGTIGAYTKFDGSQGPTIMVESEIATASMVASWRIEGEPAFGPVFAPEAWIGQSVAIGDRTVMTTDWELPTAQVFWSSTDASAPPTAIKGLDWDSVVMCQDCHTGLNAAGPHGAADNWGLDPSYPGDYSMATLTKYVTANLQYSSTMPAEIPSYSIPLSVSGIAVRSSLTTGSVLRERTDGTKGATAVICAKCHDLINQVPLVAGDPIVQNTPVVGSNTAHNSHHQDQADGSDQCVSCHIGVPHGWKVPRMLVNSAVAEAPYLDPMATGTTRTNNAVQMYRWNGTMWVEDNVVAPGRYNREGMQSLSGGDNHWAIKNHPYQQPALGLDSVNTDDMIYWSEPDCQACNDHPGEGGIRIIDAE